MGHDHHFLARLDRIQGEEIDLALSLYRDHELVSHILAIAHLPEGADRIAISLGDRHEGPFLIVQRDGHFVTCLGKGMKHDCPLLPRDRLDAIILQLGELRARREHAHAATGQDGAVALMDAVMRKEDVLTREDVTALLAVAPLMAEALLQIFVENARSLEAVVGDFSEVRRCRTDLEVDYVKAYWRVLWGQANLLVLLGAADRAFLDEIGRRLSGTGLVPTSHLARHGVFAIGARAVWFASRAGRSLVSEYKRAVDAPRSYTSFIDAACGLWAMGLRHSKLRAEVEKAMRPAQDDLAAEEPVAVLRDAFLRRITHAESSPAFEQTFLETGADMIVKIVRAFPEGSPYRAIARVEDVPVDLARTMMLMWMGDTLEVEGEGPSALMGAVPIIARAAAPDFFFPEAFAREKGSVFSPRVILAFAERHRAARAAARPPPASTARLQGRNDPCACTSGKKFKRCCGA